LPFILTDLAGGWLAAGRTRGTKSGAGRNCDVARIVRVLARFANRDRCARAPPSGLDPCQRKDVRRDQTGLTNRSNP